MYASNCPISRPAVISVPADVDLNGIGFSYSIGLFYPVSSDVDRFVLPPATQ
jgi:hypothetical protein